MSHVAYVAAAYAASAIAIAGLAMWIVLDQRAQKRALQALEARGIRRRSTDGRRGQ
ncbi:heme exporter protein CcmD [Chelativorans intermedius]|uniref:Heme exporter protein D n=1 Tax=Chelativorans intermedius TaxID=515947 RepID=A0ABV6DBF9_9HYPH|nr:heme exporter protein CcmD [Chelativorans intermedius]MCT8999349.1 heme exporter protein CcmD [Chelativorans intermedius]